MFVSARTVGSLLVGLAAVAASAPTAELAAQTIVPQSALSPSTQRYTDIIGGGIGNVVVTTGGGNANGAGDPSGRNDDGFRGPINFGYTLNFFGNSYTQFFANNNGNMSFGAGISAYIPTGPTGALQPVISPWFGDVDTRGALSGVLHVRQDIANETILTWDHVGYYNFHDDMLNNFQLIVRGPDYVIPVGEGSIGFFYGDMPWEITNTSTTAAVGFGDGAGQGEVLQGSNTSGLNRVVANHHIWFDQNLVPVEPEPETVTPEPGTYALLLTGLSVLGVVARRRRRSGMHA
jgi:hypothetical protein